MRRCCCGGKLAQYSARADLRHARRENKRRLRWHRRRKGGGVKVNSLSERTTSVATARRGARTGEEGFARVSRPRAFDIVKRWRVATGECLPSPRKRNGRDAAAHPRRGRDDVSPKEECLPSPLEVATVTRYRAWRTTLVCPRINNRCDSHKRYLKHTWCYVCLHLREVEDLLALGRQRELDRQTDGQTDRRRNDDDGRAPPCATPPAVP